MFKNSQKRKNKSNFKVNTNAANTFQTFVFDFLHKLNSKIKFSIERDLLNLRLPEPNEALFFITDRVRNPNLLIENIEKKEGINNLIIFADKTKGCTYLDKADTLILKPAYNDNNRYNLHAKIYAVNNYIILTSANLNTTNATIEHYFIINSEQFKNQLKTELKKPVKTKQKYQLPKENEIFIHINNWSYPVDLFKFIKRTEPINEIIVSNSWTNKKVIADIQKVCSNFKLISANNLLLANRSNGEWIEKHTDLTLTDIHCKIALVKTDTNNYIIFGSENYGFAVKNELEHLTITNNSELYNQIKNHLTKIKQNGRTGKQ